MCVATVLWCTQVSKADLYESVDPVITSESWTGACYGASCTSTSPSSFAAKLVCVLPAASNMWLDETQTSRLVVHYDTIAPAKPRDLQTQESLPNQESLAALRPLILVNRLTEWKSLAVFESVLNLCMMSYPVPPSM